VKNKFPAVLALLCILIYVIAVLFAAYRVFINVQDQNQIAGLELDKMHSLIAGSGESFFSEPVREAINKRLQECTVLEGIIITGVPKIDQGFEKERGRVIRWENGLQFISRFGYTSFPSREVTIPGFQNAAIHSIGKIMNSLYLVDVLKQTMLLILSALVLSFFTMIVTMLNSFGKNDAANYGGKTETKSKKEPRKSESSDDFSVPIQPDTAPEDTGGLPEFGITADDNNLPEFDATPDTGSLSDNTPEMSDAEEIGDLAETASLDDDFEIPGFEDFDSSPASTPDNTEAPADTDFHLDDFLDESDLTLPEPAETQAGDDIIDNGSDDFLDEGDLTLPDFTETQDNGADDTIIDNSSDGIIDDGDLALPDFTETQASDADDSIIDNGSDDIEIDIEDSADTEDEDTPTFGVYVLSETIDTPPAGSTKERPNGLYSPRSNIGWEAYTHDRLASELHRCAASEQDLVVLLMECGGSVNCDNNLYRKIADEAVDLFNLQDLMFEYGSQGIAVIIPGEDINQGISHAEKFRNRIYKTCYDAFINNNDLLVGMSSRSGRLIDAQRLLLEASRALGKAREDNQAPIVAFKSDPEKYREFIRNRS
jgi:hypothetical protein